MDTAISNWLPNLNLLKDNRLLNDNRPKFDGALQVVRRSAFWDEAARAAQLNEIASLRNDWDGSGAIAVSDDAIGKAQSILNSFSTTGNSPDFILPGSAGTVLFEWEKPLGTAHLEIGKSTFGFYTSPNVGEPLMYGGPFEVMNASNIQDAIATITPNSKRSSLAFSDNSLGL